MVRGRQQTGQASRSSPIRWQKSTRQEGCLMMTKQWKSSCMVCKNSRQRGDTS